MDLCKNISELTPEVPNICVACEADKILVSNLEGGKCIEKASVTVQNKFDSLSDVLQYGLNNLIVLNNM